MTRRVAARRIRREDVAAAVLVLVFVVALVGLVSLVLIAKLYEPDGFMGRPALIPACGRSYGLGPEPVRVWTRDEVDAAPNPGLEPQIFEPVLGQIPLLSPLMGQQGLDGVSVCPTLVWLHVGPDAYLAYSLLGGP